jgi:hypothetical protein
MQVTVAHQAAVPVVQAVLAAAALAVVLATNPN